MRVAIVGAGVVGLSSALALSAEHEIEIFAAQESLGTTSAVATAIWHLYLVDPGEERILKWASVALRRFLELARNEPASGITVIRGVELFRHRPPLKPPWAEIVPHFRLLEGHEIERFSGVVGGYEVDAPLADMTRYLPWLRGLCAARGIQVRRVKLVRLEDIPSHFDLVVNCAGLGARDLVADSSLQAVRGQYLVLTRPSDQHLDYVGDDDNPRGMAYMIPREFEVCVGGTEEYGVEDLRFDEDVVSMLSRAAECAPIVCAFSEADVIRKVVGLRPFREGGPRLEHSVLRDGRPVVHNYGHGGSGFTLSWGCAQAVVDLVEGREG
jgi:D-amino-acid oxidase